MAKGVKPAGRAGGEGRRRPAPAPPADLPVPPETLFLATIPGATPSTWVEPVSYTHLTLPTKA